MKHDTSDRRCSCGELLTCPEVAPAPLPLDVDVPSVLAIAKKAAEYGRTGRWNDDLAIALNRLDHDLEWIDQGRGNGRVRLATPEPTEPH